MNFDQLFAARLEAAYREGGLVAAAKAIDEEREKGDHQRYALADWLCEQFAVSPRSGRSTEIATRTKWLEIADRLLGMLRVLDMLK